MKITEVIAKLNKVLEEKGDLRVYLEVHEEERCSECGEPKDKTYDGFCDRISTISLSGEKCAWLFAERY